MSQQRALNGKRKSSSGSTLRESVSNAQPRKKDKSRRNLSDDGSHRSYDRKKSFDANNRANRDDDRRDKYKVRSDSDEEQRKRERKRGRSISKKKRESEVEKHNQGKISLDNKRSSRNRQQNHASFRSRSADSEKYDWKDRPQSALNRKARRN